MCNGLIIQGEHKVFPWLQIFITRKLRGIQTYIFFFQNVTQIKKFFLQHIRTLKKKYDCIPRSFLVINACNQGKTLCSPCMSYESSVNVFEEFSNIMYIKGKRTHCIFVYCDVLFICSSVALFVQKLDIWPLIWEHSDGHACKVMRFDILYLQSPFHIDLTYTGCVLGLIRIWLVRLIAFLFSWRDDLLRISVLTG